MHLKKVLPISVTFFPHAVSFRQIIVRAWNLDMFWGMGGGFGPQNGVSVCAPKRHILGVFSPRNFGHFRQNWRIWVYVPFGCTYCETFRRAPRPDPILYPPQISLANSQYFLRYALPKIGPAWSSQNWVKNPLSLNSLRKCPKMVDFRGFVAHFFVRGVSIMQIRFLWRNIPI